MFDRITLILLLQLVQGIGWADQVQTVKVGVFENKPIVFQDRTGQPTGFALDVLENIAEEENWQLDYVHGAWAKMLEKLDQGEIDLLVGIAYSQERSQRFDFTQQTLLSNWGAIYRAHNADITSLLDLSGKRIAYMKDSIHSKVFRDLLAQFSIEYSPVEVSDYHEVLHLVEHGKADAGVINRLFSIVNGAQYDVIATPIVFNPVEVRYASPKTGSRELLNTIDRHLTEQKNNLQSTYYTAMNHWLGSTLPSTVPAWLKWGLSSILTVLLVVLIINALLRKQVKRKTAALMEQQTQAEAAHKLLNNVIERINDGFVALDSNWCYTYVNTRAARMLQREKPEDLIGKHIWAEYPEGESQPFHQANRQALETQLPVIFEDYYQPWNQWYENRIYPSADGLTIYFTEISERKRALQALTESEVKYRSLFDNANDAIYLADSQTQQIIDANKKAVVMLGYSVDEFTQMSIPDLYPEHERVELSANFEQVVEREALSGFSGLHHKTKDGRLIPIEVNASMVEVDGKQRRLSIVRDVTERNRAESKLRESERYNRMLFEQSPIGLALSRLNGELVDVNPAFASIIGLSIEDIKHLSYWAITPEKYAEDEQCQLESLHRLGRYGPYEKEYIHKDGHLVPVRLSGMMLEKDGESFIWSSVEDITERKQAEEAVKEQMLRNEQLLQTMMDGYILADTHGNLVDVNPACCDLLGYSHEELLRKNIHEIEVQVSDEAIEQRIAQMLADGYLRFETRHRCSNGQIVDLEVSTSTIQRGDSTLIAAFVRDITERRQAEQSLYRVNRALMVLSGCDEVMIRATNEADLLDRVCSVIAEVGDYPLVWIGYAMHDENKSVKPVAQRGLNAGYLDEISISWDDNEQGRGPTGVAIRTGQLAVNNDTLSNPDFQRWQHAAKKYGLAASIALPISSSGSTYGALNIYAKVADAFDEEEMRLLQELADDLGFGIANLRTQIERQQLQRQLQQAQKMEAIGQLTGGIAHDFNNILGSIMGYTELALELYTSEAETRLVNYLKKVFQASERARDLVAQMLAFSRGVATNSKSMALEPLVKEVIKLLQSTLPSSIRIQTRTDADVSNIMMDPVHLHQVVMNLCINARDALEGEGLIEVLIRQVSDIKAECDSCHEHVKGDFVELGVRDNGKGIEPTVIERIFDPFFSTKETAKGTGMGLSMVHGIVHEHGGHILVETATGNGSTFRLLFPAVSEYPHAVELEVSEGSGYLQGANEGHLLIVDDDESVAMFVTELLSLDGYQVTMMTNSTEALSLFRQNPKSFDLVITDQTMPGITGDELAKSMLLLRPDIPIILCTGYSEKIDEEKARALGTQKFMQKPLKPKILLESVSELLRVNENSG